ncbi:AAA family ATPase [Weeksellaceae bacterium KMM 9724]|uniref:SbcC/MukB-like Walker B domain-containing protein n=1 Tax=Profundicola chukchiensis TaxID=2961959 RepID=UPI00243A8376|nr:AAA family ATPase [Profundicola chukchiensis]MDG4951010.1 AAA family ATPase [Profundicola chukchiensis]
MKILRIDFKNINSLQGEHSIDFRDAPFYGDKLFAITGATGSGKSTLLDILVLALFNRTPRFSKISKSEIEHNGAILTRGQKDAYARVTYECSQGEFVSEWSISTARTGNLRDYEMQVSDVLTQTSLVDKKSEVPAKNEELIGLKYDQFIKSVMLAQGEFAEFLVSKKAERTILLEKITGTDIYRKLGMKAFDKYRNIKGQIEDLEKNKANWQAELLDKEVVAEIKKSKEDLDKDLKLLSEEQTKFKSFIELKNNILNTQKELTQWENQEKANQESFEKFKINEGVALEKHKLVEPIQHDLINWNRIQKETKENKNLLNENLKEFEKINSAKSEFKSTIESLLKKEVSAKDYEQELSKFEQTVVELNRTSEKQINEGRSLKNEIEALIRPFNLKLEKEYSKVNEQLKEIQSKSTAFITENNFSVISISELEKKLTEIEVQSELLQKAKADVIHIENTQKEISTNKKEISEIEELIKALPKTISEQEEKLKNENTLLENFSLKSANQKLLASLDDHRKKLKEGEACPLCGALDHPFATHIPEDNTDELDKQIELQTNKVKQIETDLNSNKTTFKLKSESLNKLKTKLKELETTLAKLINDFKEKYNYALDTHWEEKSKEFKDAHQLHKKAIEFKNQLEITLISIPKMEKMLAILEKAQATSKQLKELYSEQVPIEQKVSSLERKWNEIQSEQKVLESKKESLVKIEKDLEQDLKDLVPKIKSKIQETDLSDISEAFAALLSYEDLTQLEAKQNKLKEHKQEISIKKNSILESLNELKLKDNPLSLEELNTQFSTLQTQETSKKKDLEEINRKLSNQSDYQKKIKEIEEKIKEESKNSRHWILLNELIGDSTGKKFNNFAQDLTLMQLLHLANQRLKMLSKRYIMDSATKDEDESLVVIDKDMGGQRRSVKTLSGGETFVLSLALALALSDLASSNVQINSLFIDEGFGTLDPETLDQTLTTLEQLQEEGSKMIGIISHVSTLKERIATQIQIVPNGRGFSSVNVVG